MFLEPIDDEDCWISATQGHTIKGVDESGMTKITDASRYHVVCHGTEAQHVSSIINKGLSRMTRNHIHFTPTDKHKGTVSGFRNRSEVLVYIDLDKALKDGVQFFLSKNGVILSAGLNQSGYLPKTYFKKIVNRRSGHVYWSAPTNKAPLRFKEPKRAKAKAKTKPKKDGWDS